ncbi:ATP-binding protein [Persephonella sp.]
MEKTKKNLIKREAQEEVFTKSLSEKNIYLVNGQSGCGKSTFFLNFFEEKGFNFIYIPLTTEDVDPVNFFNKINQKLSVLNGNYDLPKLTVEMLFSLDIFTKKYFEELENKVKEVMFIIFDDVQNIKESKESIKIIKTLLSMNLKNKKLIFLTKEDLFIPYFNWEVERKIFRIDTNFFRFTDEDIKEFFLDTKKKNLTDWEIENILHSTEGIIGKILITGEKSFHSIRKNLEEKLLSIISEDDIKLLCYFYNYPIINEKNLSQPDEEKRKIIDILETLNFENLFVKKTISGFKLHDLLKNYLSMKSKEFFRSNYKDFIREKAFNLYRSGFIDESLELLKSINDFKSISAILEENIINLIFEGKVYSTQKYLSYLKETEYINHPLFLYAQGYLLKFEKPDIAIEYFQKSLEIFQKINNTSGEKLVIGELFDLAQFYGEDFEIGGKYLSRAEELINQSGGNFSIEDIRLISYMGIIYLLYAGNSIKSTYYFRLLNKFLKDNTPFTSYIKIYGAISLSAAGEFVEAEKYYEEAKQIYETIPKNPNDVFMFNFLTSIYETFTGRFRESVERIRSTLEYTRAWGLTVHEEHMITRIVESLLCLGKTKEARIYLEEIEKLPYRTSFSKGMTYQLKAQMYLIEKNYDLAVESANHSIHLFKKINGKMFVIPTKSLLAVAYIGKGLYDKAEKILNEIIDWSESAKSYLQKFTSLIHLSYLYIQKNDSEKLKHTLNEALKLGKEKKITAIYNQYPELLKKVLNTAVSLNIHTDYAKYLIYIHNLSDSKKPKVKIYTFGNFKVTVNDNEIVDWKGEKPLSLLKTIVALKGENIPVDKIINIIWDGYDYIRAKQNFEFTLRKLRKILDDNSKNIIILKNNRISLNKELVWIDLWEFDELYSELEFLLNRNKLNYLKDTEKFQKIKSLYKGKFLELEEDIWIDPIRYNFDEKFNKIRKFYDGKTN